MNPFSGARPAMQSLAERVHDRFLEMDKRMEAGSWPGREADSHGESPILCKASQKSRGKSLSTEVHPADAALEADAANSDQERLPKRA